MNDTQTTVETRTGPGEFTRGWRVLIASLLGTAFGASPLPYNTIGFFIEPLQREFGWTKAEVSFGVTVYGVLGALLAVVRALGAGPAPSWRAMVTGGVCAGAAVLTRYQHAFVVIALGAWLAFRGEISAGAMIASNVLMGNALRPIGILVSTWKEFVQARQSYRDIGALLDKYPEREPGHASERVYGQVTVRQLSAYARQREKPILDNIDVRFESGEVIGIVGPSGAGKSTFARCLLGIWPSTSGQVLLDGVEIRSWSRDALGPHVGYLPQDIELFDGTIAENICRFGITDRTLDSESIVDAAKRADIHPMILRLPQGYDTSIGVAGQLLSAGQRQRLALARALYRTPDIVVLDEPNANLDDAGELALGNAIRALRAEGKTVFMVLHQRSLLALADRVLAMADGRITTYGKIEVNPAPLPEATQGTTH